ENAWLSNDPQRGKRTTSQSSPLRIPLPPDHHKPETLSGHPLAKITKHLLRHVYILHPAN
ncbi:MAG: hypothetical protein WAO83_10740, partial [Fuerstiella sp.]